MGPGELPPLPSARPMNGHGRQAPNWQLGVTGMLAVALLLVGIVEPASAHALGHPFRLPVPSWLYVAGAAIAVAASFVISGVALRVSPDVPRYPRLAIPKLPAQVLSGLLAAVGLVWWYGAVVAGLFVGGQTPIPVILLWIFIWAGLPIFAALLGNPWPSLSPF